MTLLPKDDAEGARYALAKFEGRLESLDVEPVAPQWALPFGPRFRLRRNHACGVFPPSGFNR
jgi:hypothetical protein